MDKLFVATLKNYFEKKNVLISKTTSFPGFFQKPKLPLQKILEKYQNK